MQLKESELELLLNTANWVRETGKLEDALPLAQITLKLSEESNYPHGIVHSYLLMLHAHELLFQTTKDTSHAEGMKQALDQATSYASTHQLSQADTEAIIENTATYYSEIQDWGNAEIYWSKFVSTHSEKDIYHFRGVEHLAESQLELGNVEEAIANARLAVQGIEQNDERKISVEHEYRWLVWYTGAMKKLFLCLHKQNPENAELVDLRKKIEDIQSDPRLSHRRRQWSELLQKYKID